VSFRGIVATTGEIDPQSADAIATHAFGKTNGLTLEIWDRRKVIEEFRSDSLTELVDIVNRDY